LAIDYSVIREISGYINGTVSDLDEYHVTREQLEQNTERAAAVKYLTQTAVEACANIAEHIIFGLNLGNPVTSKELFPILVEHHIISQELSAKLQQAVGLRNILVHLYRKVDLAILADSASVGLDDLREFVLNINTFLEKNSADNAK
jgi:uncharacterized protein YutE (UPF0331/DUF86 family)